MSQPVESVLSFPCGDATLMGVLSLPPLSSGAPSGAVIIVVGGPQYRAGSHRQFTLLARRLASAGVAVLRFDYRGMGDSEGEARDFRAVSPDIASAVDALHRELPTLSGVTLWGLCDAASALLLYMDEHKDPRISGLCLMNPWVRSEASFARTQIRHYYASRLVQADFWKKLLSGQVALSALREIAQQLKRAASRRPASASELSFQQRMARAWRGFDGPLLLLLSEVDLVAKEFLEQVNSSPEWSGALARPRLKVVNLANADHTCSNKMARALVEEATLSWQMERQIHG